MTLPVQHEKPGLLTRLFSRKPFRDEAGTIYVSLVEQARLPVFYTRAGVADTLDGRFDMIVLHAVLVMDRIETAALATNDQKTQTKATQLAQALFDYMFDDLDRSLREIGVGDISVPKKIKQMAQAFYGRADAYQKALTAGEGLEEALKRNLYRGRDDVGDEASLMATYTTAQHDYLADASLAELMAGRVTFAEPAL